jgi:hypothetical protein
VPSNVKGKMTAQADYDAGPFKTQLDKTSFVVR